MPSSSHFHISKMIDWIIKTHPTSILDIGVGYGKWGFLAREYTDINNHNYAPATWQVRIDGVEAFPRYATPTYDYVYSQIYYGDARELLPTLPDYDLVILGDVIEHFSKEDGRQLLAQLRKKARFILLSSPTQFFQQELFCNDYETHRSLWGVHDFADFAFDFDEYDQWVFVALLRGDLARGDDLSVNGWAAQVVYSRTWLKKRPKVAQLAKSLLQRLPRSREANAP